MKIMNDKEKTNENWFFRQSKVVKVAIAIFGVCCIGLIILSLIGSILPDSMISGNFSESKTYDNEYISFKYPKSLIDITAFHHQDDGSFIFFSMFGVTEPERTGMVVSSKDIHPSLVPTYLDQFYENYSNQMNDGVKSRKLEKVYFNGIPSIKMTEEYYESDSGKYGILLIFVHNGKDYGFYFRSDSRENTEYMYELAESTLILK